MFEIQELKLCIKTKGLKTLILTLLILGMFGELHIHVYFPLYLHFYHHSARKNPVLNGIILLYKAPQNIGLHPVTLHQYFTANMENYTLWQAVKSNIYHNFLKQYFWWVKTRIWDYHICWSLVCRNTTPMLKKLLTNYN